MQAGKKKLTLDKSTTYQIQIPGELNSGWFDWARDIKVTVGFNDDGQPVTTLTGVFDQAALQGLLRRLYSLGLPILSVVCVDQDSTQRMNDENE